MDLKLFLNELVKRKFFLLYLFLFLSFLFYVMFIFSKAVETSALIKIGKVGNVLIDTPQNIISIVNSNSYQGKYLNKDPEVKIQARILSNEGIIEIFARSSNKNDAESLIKQVINDVKFAHSTILKNYTEETKNQLLIYQELVKRNSNSLATTDFLARKISEFKNFNAEPITFDTRIIAEPIFYSVPNPITFFISDILFTFLIYSLIIFVISSGKK